MKLLIVFPSLEFGGIERTTLNLVKNFKSFETSIILHRHMARYMDGLGSAVHMFEDFGAQDPSLSMRSLLAYTRAVKAVSSIERPDIVLAIMQYAPIYSALAKDLFFMRAKVSISYRGAVSVYIKRISPQRRFRHLVGYSVRRASNVIVPSEGVKRDLMEHFGASENKTHVIYNGIDLDFVRRSAGEEADIKKERPWIVTSARLSPQKDFPTLLRAFRKVRDSKDASLVILGEGPLRQEISSLAKDLGIERDVMLLGFQENPFKYMARGDMFVFSSFFEGFGNVLVEAMALGLPVVSTDCPYGPGEIITEGQSGLLVPVEDHNLMAERMLRVLEDGALSARLSEGGRKRAEDFSALKMAENYEERLKRLL